MTACAQPGCGGTIEDGYCTVCGLAAAPPASQPAPPASQPAPPASQPAGLDVTATSSPASTSVSVPVSRATRGSRSSTGRSARGHLGAGLVDVPPVPARDPASAVLKNPQVAESKRFCGNCGKPVGRGRDGAPGLTEGFCRNCGRRFSYRPKLEAGELVGGQYELLGCLAHGGLGWIYLSRDRNVSDRWVVLKGLLDTGDADAQAAAVAERRFLAEVEHPSIVRIYNFVQHRDRQTGETTGYIVMEYVGGQSLKQIALERRNKGLGPLPLAQALAYAIEALPALGYLHDLGLVYCDFKPDNVIQTEEQLKLIDMGGVRRIDDQDSPIYGTVGYQAPEIADAGPSASSDLYTVARSLAVLTFDFTGYTTIYKHSLPDQASVPLLAQQESFCRLLRRATHVEPLRRFTAAAEMAQQLTGVLREVLAAGDGQQRPALSTQFTPELRAVGAARAASVGEGAPPPGSPPDRKEIVSGLPVPQADGTDPATSYLAALSTLSPAQQADALRLAVAGAPGAPAGLTESIEARLALARVRLISGDIAGATLTLEELIARGDADWRVTWYQGMCGLASGALADARGAFEAVYDNLPGELAPKLAIALAAEAAGDREAATRYFRLVWTVDHSYVSAAFGLARVLIAAGDAAGAVGVLAAVPETSSHYVAAQIAAVRARVCGRDPARLTVADLREAGERLARLEPDAARRESLTIDTLQAALSWVTAGNAAGNGAGHGAAGGRLLGCDLTERALRFGLERSYRALARLASGPEQRIELVNLANEVRPRTWW
jgi:serine/threonine-protein kinase PknG